MTDDRVRVVERAYDALADRFLEWSQRVEGDPRPRLVERFRAALPEGAAVVDLGCGAGVPTTARLAERFAVTGVDISAEQLRRARRLVPRARLVQADMTAFDPGKESFDGVTACYSLTHLPGEHQPAMLSRIATLASSRRRVPGQPRGERRRRLERGVAGRPDVLLEHRAGRRPRSAPGCRARDRAGRDDNDPRARGRGDLPVADGPAAQAA